MSIRKCATCGRTYWRYSTMHPAGYCSVPCYEARRKKESKPTRPEPAAELVQCIRYHRELVHNTHDIHLWFDCETCENLERRLAVSLGSI